MNDLSKLYFVQIIIFDYTVIPSMFLLQLHKRYRVYVEELWNFFELSFADSSDPFASTLNSLHPLTNAGKRAFCRAAAASR